MACKNKKYKKKVDGKTICYGAKGYRIKPGTKAGDSYCARSLGINKKYGIDCSKTPNTPNCLSRKKWKCKGKKSSSI